MSRSPQRREHDHPKTDRPRDARQRLDTDDLKALKAVGSFRIVDKSDLKQGNVQMLINRGYVIRKTLHHPGDRQQDEILTPSKKGLDYLRDEAAPGDRQRYWSGIVKPREVAHDLAIYRAYQQEAEEIETAGGKINRVVLDFEFKSQINSEMNKPGPKPQAERRRDLAEEHELPLVDGKVMLPDARIEYVDADGKEHHKDIEVVTAAYRGSMMAAKSKSGFHMHSAKGRGSDPRASVLDDHNRGYL